MKMIKFSGMLLLAVCIAGCKSNNKVEEKEPVKVKIMEVSSYSGNEESKYSGTVEAENGTSLSFSVMGTVDKVYVSLGEQVTKGQLIASLNPTSLQSSYNAAQATLQQAEDAWKRLKELHDKGSLPEIKWVEAESTLQQARATEEIARKSLNDCKLYAPFSGVIAEKNIEVGQNVAPGIPIVQLVTTRLLKIKISVPETEISDITLGQKAEVSVPALNNQIFETTVTEKGVVANPLSRSYDVKMRVTDAGKSLMPGMVAEVALQKKDSTAQYIIPANIVQLDENNQSFVWLNNNGKAEKRIVSCGEFTPTGVTVVAGLKSNDQIIVEGRQKVCNGTPIVF